MPGQDDLSNGGSPSALATQAVSLGDHLLGVTTNHTLSGISVIDEFVSSGTRDIHFFFTTPS